MVIKFSGCGMSVIIRTALSVTIPGVQRPGGWGASASWGPGKRSSRTLRTSRQCGTEGFNGGPLCVPHCAGRRQSIKKIVKVPSRMCSTCNAEMFVSVSFQCEENSILLTIFLLIVDQPEFLSVHNQSENGNRSEIGKYKLILIDLSRIKSRFVYMTMNYSDYE